MLVVGPVAGPVVAAAVTEPFMEPVVPVAGPVVAAAVTEPVRTPVTEP